MFYRKIGTTDSLKKKEFEIEEKFEEVDIKLDLDEDDKEGLKNMFSKLWEMYGEEPIEL
nr:hypothetical protein [Bacillus thuringiensis]